MLFKIYDGDVALFFTTIAALADFCEVTRQEARKAYYQGAAILNGREVINLSRK